MQSSWDARISTELSAAGIIKGAVRSSGDPNVRIVTPGSPSQSLLLTRISQLGPGHMPPLATTVLNTEAMNLISDWISQDLGNHQTFADWQIKYFGSTDSPDAQPNADPDHDGTPNQLEYLLGRNPLDPSDSWKISVERAGEVVQITFPWVQNVGFEVQVSSDLNDPGAWRPVSSPLNKPSGSSPDQNAVVQDVTTPSSARFYRVRVFAP